MLNENVALLASVCRHEFVRRIKICITQHALLIAQIVKMGLEELRHPDVASRPNRLWLVCGRRDLTCSQQGHCLLLLLFTHFTYHELLLLHPLCCAELENLVLNGSEAPAAMSR